MNAEATPTPSQEGKQPEKLPRLKLVGEDGNAFAIMGRAQAAAKKAGWAKEKIDEVMKEARAGDYNHLLGTMMKYFDVT